MDERIQLCTTYIKEIEKNVKEKAKSKYGIDLELEAFILSISRYDDIKKSWEDGRFKTKSFNDAKEEFKKHNIIFQESKNYIEEIFEKIDIN